MADEGAPGMPFSGLVDQVRSIMPECIRLRREIHSNPELSMGEHGTAKHLSAFLAAHGLKPTGYGFPSVVCDTGPSPRVAIRADMDALPIVEESGEEFSSMNQGAMHACGHDAHSAILACAGVILSRAGIPVRLIFQPAEETGQGARMMISEGVLDGVDRIFGLHVWPSLDTGTMAVLDGPAMAGNSLFSARLYGGGGHGAYPHLAADTITAASSFIMNANSIVSRNIDPLDRAVISFGQLEAGRAPNVIPSEVGIKGTIRYFSAETKGVLKGRLERLLADASSSFGLKHAISWFSEGPAVINDSGCAASLSGAISPWVKMVACNPTMGSEDFAYYLHERKGAFAFLGTGSGESTRRSKHSSRFRLDEDSLYYGILSEVVAGGTL